MNFYYEMYSFQFYNIDSLHSTRPLVSKYEVFSALILSGFCITMHYPVSGLTILTFKAYWNNSVNYVFIICQSIDYSSHEIFDGR